MRICPRCNQRYHDEARFCPVDDAVLVEPIDYDRIGTTIGNYKLLDIIGRGGMGTVYRAEHVYIGKRVAVKVLHERFAKYDDAIRRFLREARTASSIQHPNIADVTDFGHIPDGGVFFTMEYLEGESLEGLIEREAPLALHRAINIANQAASALAAAHDKSVVHRDLKPENMILTKRPGRRDLVRAEKSTDGASQYVVEREDLYDFVKIIDFGIALVRDPQAMEAHEGHASMVGAIVGTPEYMAPEAARGEEVDHRADIYSLGVIFFDMLAGRPPFEAPTAVEVLSKHISAKPPSPREVNPKAEVTPAAEALIRKALSKNPADRHRSMDEFRLELNDCYGNTVFKRDVDRFPAFRQAGLSPEVPKSAEVIDQYLRTQAGAGRSIPPPLPSDVVGAVDLTEEADIAELASADGSRSDSTGAPVAPLPAMGSEGVIVDRPPTATEQGMSPRSSIMDKIRKKR